MNYTFHIGICGSPIRNGETVSLQKLEPLFSSLNLNQAKTPSLFDFWAQLSYQLLITNLLNLSEPMTAHG